MNVTRKTLDLDRLKQNLQQISVDATSVHVPGTIGRNNFEEALHLAAAVLTTFDPWQLHPFGPVESDDPKGPAIERLLANCSLRYDDHGRPCWSLKHSTRKQALKRLGTRERMLQALDLADGRPDDRLQTIFEANIRQTAEPIDQQSLVDLRHTLQVIGWLSESDLAAELPSAENMQTRIAWEELMQSFRYLVRDGFFGREDLLQEFHEFVDAAESRSPLLIYGPGGVGKSTVLAEFVLQRTDRQAAKQRVPFTYVDFDQADIDPHEPLTILMAAADQLAVQYPEMAPSFSMFIEEWSYRLTAETIRGDQNILGGKGGTFVDGMVIVGGSTSKGSPSRGQSKQIHSYVSDFRALFEQLDTGDRAWLLLLDTFEEVQLRSSDVIPVINNFLEILRAQIPQARIIIAGRGNAEGTSFVGKELEGFDEEDAVTFLQHHDVTDPAVARQIFQVVTGNPLSLKLAARIVKQENLADALDSAVLREVLRKVAEGNIQGQLYRRVLDHINNPDVRKLAHPGLTLRLITPDIIATILADACKVEVKNEADAQRLFNLLSQEITLVIPVGPGLLRHRPDVRAVMIAALHNDKPLVVHAIHKAAVAYYEGKDEAEARAEEIYHRLFIDPDFSVIEIRWEPRFHEALKRLLLPALYELTPRARAWLAGQLQLTGVEDVNWDESDLPDWERYTEKRVVDRIRSNDWTGALELLGERRERTVGSPLFFLETTILRQQERWQEARRTAYDGIYSMQVAKNDAELLNLLRQAIAIDLQLCKIESVQNELERARTLLAEQAYFDEIVALELDLFDLKLARELPAFSAKAVEQLRQTVQQRFDKLSDRELLSHPQIIRDTLAEVGNESSAALSKGLRLMTFGELTDETRETLAHSMHIWDIALSKKLEQPPGVLLREVDPSLPFDDGWQTYFLQTSSARLTRDIERLLEQYGDVVISGDIVAGGDINIGGGSVAGDNVTFDQTGQSIVGSQINIGVIGGDIVHIGDT